MADQKVEQAGVAAPVAEQPIPYEETPDAEAAAPAADSEEEATPDGPPVQGSVPTPQVGGMPSWVIKPPELKVPRGRVAIFIRFPAEWTDTPNKGIELPGEKGIWRICICWVVSVGDKKLAYQRCQGDQTRVIDELTRSMIRSVDGVMVDWSGENTPGNIDTWWAAIGERCRQRLTQAYMATHNLNGDQMRYFFESCIAVRTAG